jgi:hypothetical protein
MSASLATILGGIVGLLIGHYLTRSWQLKQWKLENRRAEYRELLSKLSAGYTAAMSYGEWSTTEGREDVAKTEKAATACIRDRIFIADEIWDYDLLRRWETSLDKYDHNPHNTMEFYMEFEHIRKDLVQIAKKDLYG